MSRATYSQMFELYLDHYTYVAKRHPKAAKKKRIQKKWRRKYGVPLAEVASAMLANDDGALFGLSISDNSWSGGTYHVAFPAEVQP